MTFKIYTKTGDKGETSLIGGTRVPKYNQRIETYGTIDELNSYVGLVKDSTENQHIKNSLYDIQNCLFTIGSHLAADPAKSKMDLPELKNEDVKFLESEIDTMEETLPELINFILPGGHPTSSFCHIARCVCRRSERLAVQLQHESGGLVDNRIIMYLNRLSDYLFVLARKLAQEAGAPEVPWIPGNRTIAE